MRTMPAAMYFYKTIYHDKSLSGRFFDSPRRGVLPKPPIDLDNSRINEADMSEGANDMSKSNKKFRPCAQSDRLALRGYAAGTAGSVPPAVDQGEDRRSARSGGNVSRHQGAHGSHVHREYVFPDVCGAACA